MSFIPFEAPRGWKVLYVVNRVDVVCETSGRMGRVREYFRDELERTLRDGGIRMGGDEGKGIGVEVHPVSALKGWGVKELLARIFQLRNAESNVYLIGTSSHLYPLTFSFELILIILANYSLGHTNVGKSSIISALLKTTSPSKQTNPHAPTISIFPHTTLGSIPIPLRSLRPPARTMGDAGGRGMVTRGVLVDTPGIEGDATFLNGLIMPEYRKVVSLVKVAGFQRPAVKMVPGIFNHFLPYRIFSPASLLYFKLVSRLL